MMHAGDKESQAGPTLASNYTMEPQSSQRPVFLLAFETKLFMFLGLGTLSGSFICCFVS